MKVMNLRCAHDHRFEGWFASDDEMHAQLGSGALTCPVCDDAAITRLPSAPHIAISHARAPQAGSAAPSQPMSQEQARQAAWLTHLRRAIAKTEDVGDRFAAEARRIHDGQAEARAIRGQASAQEARGLVEDGIEIMALPTPEAFKGPLQ